VGQPDYTGSSMLALYPPPEVAKALAVDGGLDPADMHVTIAYTGDAADVDRNQLRKAAKQLAKRPPFKATISGHARFTGGDQDAIVALVDAPELELLRADARKQLGKRGIAIPSEHSFTAHMTLKYVGKDDPSPVARLTPRKVPFAAVSAAHGSNRKDHPFDTSIQSAAIEAYATGWVLSGGPMTDRVRAGCAAAVELAIEHASDPHILEATLNIGKLEGTWATFFDRREQLTSKQIKLIIAILASITAGLPVTTLVDRLRAEAGAGVYTADYLKTLTTQAAGGLLAGIYAHDSHNDLQGAVEDALRTSMAEGKTGSLALNAEKHGVDFDFAKAYQAIFDQLEHLPDLPMMAQQWVQDMVGGASRQIGGLLARLFEDGATRQEMIDELKAALNVAGDGSVTNRAVTYFLSQAMATAMSKASLDLYASEGAAEAYFVTAGASACPMCEQIENGNPYAVADCPVPGQDTHGGCRCVVVVDDPAPFKALAAFIG
jgi:2'-5' RNA ligase